MTILAVTDFIGRFHPVVVHLPIGILLMACLFQVFSKKVPMVKPAIPVMIFWGMLGAVISCITGYLLSLSGDYEAAIVGRHQWFGIATAILSLLLYLVFKFSASHLFANIMASITILLVAVTGHLGGSLTHGANYLTEGLSNDNSTLAVKPIPNIQEALIYADVVQPILQRKCYNCHGSSKQKGKLRLDEPPYILKGGEDGVIIKAGNIDESELIKRLLLPLTDEDHMPPKEKPQLTTNEVAVLSWWIATGASFDKRVKEVEQTNTIKPVLIAFQSGSTVQGTEKKVTDVPEDKVPPADEAQVKKLKDQGVMVMPVAHDNNYLSVNFVTAGDRAAGLIKLLEPLKKQIVWLKLDNSNIKNTDLAVLGSLSGLTRLSLSNTSITDDGLINLKSLKELQFLNLVGTQITERGIESLQSLKKLRSVYLYRTAINKANWQKIKQLFPKTVFDSGGYVLPTFQSDTTVVTQDNKK